AEVWLSLIHGSRGLIYFVHQFKPTFDEHALLDDPEMLRSVTATNRQIRELAPVLNSPTVPPDAAAAGGAERPAVDRMVKRYRSATYLFAVNHHPEASKGVFTLKSL